MKKVGWFVEIGLYVVLALYALWPSLTTPGTVPGDRADLYGTIWFYWWMDECVRGLHSPSTTDLFFYPWGKDILAHTGNHFLDALVATPLHALLGPVRFLDWWVLVVMVGNALAMRPLARHLLEERWAVVLVCALWSVNPYFALELAAGRVTQVFAWALPLAFLGLLRVDRSWTWAVGTGVLVALVGYGYWYYGYFFALAAPWLVGVELWERRGETASWRRYLVLLGVAAGVAVALVLPMVLAVALSAQAPAALTPTFDTQLAGVQAGGALLGAAPGPVSIPLPWVLGLLAWVVLGQGRLRWLGVAGVGAAITVGPTQELRGAVLEMHHYRLLLEWLPWWHRLGFPDRSMILIWLAASLGMGTVIQRGILAQRDQWGAQGAWLVPVAGILAVAWVVADLDEYLPLPVTPIPDYAAYGWMEVQGGAIVDLPLDQDPLRFVHQVQHPIPVFGGMGVLARDLWPPQHAERMESPCARQLLDATSAQAPAPAPPARCQALVDQGFRWAVLHLDAVRGGADDPHARERVTRNLELLLGPPVIAEGPLVVYALDRSGEEVVSP